LTVRTLSQKESQESRIGAIEGKVELMHETLNKIDGKVDSLSNTVSEIKGILQNKKQKRSFRQNLGIALLGAGTSGLVSFILFLVIH
jgi:hypothetical protein